MSWDVNTALGWLLHFWSEVAELTEGGDITGWTPEYLCELTNLNEESGTQLWDALHKSSWISTVGEKVIAQPPPIEATPAEDPPRA